MGICQVTLIGKMMEVFEGNDFKAKQDGEAYHWQFKHKDGIIINATDHPERQRVDAVVKSRTHKAGYKSSELFYICDEQQVEDLAAVIELDHSRVLYNLMPPAYTFNTVPLFDNGKDVVEYVGQLRSTQMKGFVGINRFGDVSDKLIKEPGAEIWSLLACRSLSDACFHMIVKDDTYRAVGEPIDTDDGLLLKVKRKCPRKSVDISQMGPIDLQIINQAISIWVAIIDSANAQNQT